MEGPRPVWAVKVIMVIVIASIFFRCVSARNHTVGGPNGWDLASNLQVWSRSSTFYTGDNLVFSYTPNHDVLEVNQLDFARCRTISPLATHRDGETVVPLTNAGTRFFICGRRGHCTRGLRLMVQVLELPSAAPAFPPAEESAASEPTRRERAPPPGKGDKSSPPPPPAAMGAAPAKSPGAEAHCSVGVRIGGWVWCCLALAAVLVMFSDLYLIDEFN
ncbi:hypothetical protein AAG906_036825 [Vitis piasezkii]